MIDLEVRCKRAYATVVTDGGRGGSGASVGDYGASGYEGIEGDGNAIHREG
jgi:hypothetical protein